MAPAASVDGRRRPNHRLDRPSLVLGGLTIGELKRPEYRPLNSPLDRSGSRGVTPRLPQRDRAALYRPMTQTIAQKLDVILRDPGSRKPMLSIFAGSMGYIRGRKPDWCIVQFSGKHLRLFAGRLIVLTLESDEVWVTTDPDDRSVDWSRLLSWRWDEHSYPRYRRPPSRNGYYSPRVDAGGEWEQIRSAHQRYLERALNPGIAPDHRSFARHEPAVVEYIDAIVPDPARALPVGDETEGPVLPFDPQLIDDERDRNLALIVQRRGQSEFRESLLRAYNSTCCFSGCNVEQVLEAAHIVPYQGLATNHVRNGLLLRTDLHTLFDLGLITVDAATMTIIVDPALAGSMYAEFDGHTIRLPRDPNDRPAEGLLEYHRQRSNEAIQRTRCAAR